MARWRYTLKFGEALRNAIENEDYEGLEDGAFDDDETPKGPAGASPLNFFS